MEFLSEKFFQHRAKVYLFLLLPAAILFFKTLGYGFTSMDEQWIILRNVPFLEKWSSLGGAFIKPLNEAYYRPLFIISFILDYHIGHLSPFIYHFTGLLLHLVCVVLLFQFLALFSGDQKSAFICALLFSVHPILLHAIVWIPGRNDLLLCVFTLLSFIYLYKYIHTPGPKFLLLQVLFFCCALFTKENAIVLPVVFGAIYFIVETQKKNRGYVLTLFWMALSILFFILHRHIVAGVSSVHSASSGNFANFIGAFFLYTGKVIFPVYQSILPNVKTHSVILGVLGLGLIILLSFAPGLKNKKLAFLGLFIFVVLLIIPVWFGAFKSGSEHYEHRSYTSVAGLLLFFSQLKLDLRSRSLANGLMILFCFFFIKSFVRMQVYKSVESFIQSGLKDRPDFYLFYVQEGEILYKQHDYALAEDCFSQAIRLRPDKGNIYSQRGSARYAQKRYQEAIVDFTQAITRSDFKKEYFINRCTAYTKSGQVEEAMKDLSVLQACCLQSIPPGLVKDVTAKFQNLNTLRSKL